MYWILRRVFSIILELLSPWNILKWIYILAKTFPRDVSAFLVLIRGHTWAKKVIKENYTIPKLFHHHVEKNPKKVAFYFEDEAWTFEKVEEFSNKVANYFGQEGYQRGDTIALLLENCAAFPAIWLGLSKIGVITALINTNLMKESLTHSIVAASCKAVIVGTAHVKAIHEISEHLQVQKLYQFRYKIDEVLENSIESVDLTEILNRTSGQIVMPREVFTTDPVINIYTSGTTGLPKAAVMSHSRFLVALKALSNFSNITSEDIIYIPLPLYHSTGGALGIGQVFITGATCVIRKKFSATNYFKDCARYKATIGLYIGELCRYLLAVPEDHTVNYPLKAVVGTGLKAQIWKQFLNRFGIKNVVELYGSTEGNGYLGNRDGTIGAVGFIPRYLKWASSVCNILCDEATGEPVRNQDGFCIECGVREPGVFIGRMSKNAVISFEGYTDKQASDKKVLRNVFRKGDMYFNFGDILEYDEFGYYYFKDRTGDTFRWKGENVSTSEVEGVISNIVHLNDVAVYGVEVQHGDGKAGMAAVVDANRNLNVESFGTQLKQALPSYAIPLFLRVMDSVPITGTFKLKKNDLKAEGYNINETKDDLYFYHPKLGRYVPLTKEIREELDSGKLKI